MQRQKTTKLPSKNVQRLWKWEQKPQGEKAQIKDQETWSSSKYTQHDHRVTVQPQRDAKRLQKKARQLKCPLLGIFDWLSPGIHCLTICPWSLLPVQLTCTHIFIPCISVPLKMNYWITLELIWLLNNLSLGSECHILWWSFLTCSLCHVSCLLLTVSAVFQQAFNGLPSATLGRLSRLSAMSRKSPDDGRWRVLLFFPSLWLKGRRRGPWANCFHHKYMGIFYFYWRLVMDPNVL